MKKTILIFVLVIIIIGFFAIMIEQQETIQTLANKEIVKPSNQKIRPTSSYVYKSNTSTKIDLQKLNYN